MRKIILSAAALAVLAVAPAYAATAAKKPAPAALTDTGTIAAIDAKGASITVTDTFS